MTTPTEEHVRITAKLYEARATARALLGATFAARMTEYGNAIRMVAERKGITQMQAAIQIAKAAQDEGKPYTSITVLAAAVELVEPSPEETNG